MAIYTIEHLSYIIHYYGLYTLYYIHRHSYDCSVANVRSVLAIDCTRPALNVHCILTTSVIVTMY